jgi:hypothetical protein
MHDTPQRCLSRPTPAKTPDSLVAMAWNWFTLRLGIDLLLTLRPLQEGGTTIQARDRAVTPCRPKDSQNPLSEAFLRRNFAQCGISAIIEARREDPAAYLRAYVALLVLPGWRARARVRKQILAGAPRDISSPPTGAGSTSVGHQDFVLLRRLHGKG